MILVHFTTAYREGGAQFRRVAKTLADTRAHRMRASSGVSPRVVVEEVHTKRQWVRSILEHSAEAPLHELHFVGHGGMYGPMVGTTEWPEQLSPHEWAALAPGEGPGRVRLAADASVHIHTCRSARWFAPFLARTWGVPCAGNHWYTTFSSAPHRFRHPRLVDEHAPLYLFGCPGKTSHGWLAAAHKYLRGGHPEEMQVFEPTAPHPRQAYDAVAEDYDRTFDDISVRSAEIGWIESRLAALEQVRGRPLRVLEIGCGNGALLERLAGRLDHGLGVDISPGLLALASRRLAPFPNIETRRVRGPVLPSDLGELDVILSMLSWRYLDWDPMLAEVHRIATQHTHLWVLDMVAKPAPVSQFPRMLFDHARERIGAMRNPAFRRARARMVQSDAWRSLVAHNPMRAQHEYDWFFRSRFPGTRREVLSVSRRAQMMAYDCGRVNDVAFSPMTYP